MEQLLVIGAGPAGVSAALYARRGGLAVTVVAKDGGALEKAEHIENYYGLAEPVTGAELARRGVAGAERLGVAFAWEEIVSLRLNDTLTGFMAATKEHTYEAGAVVLATGAARKRLPVPGLKELEGKGVSYCAVCDAFFYRGKAVAILGAGEYALHEAAVLAPLAAKVTLLTDGAPAPAARRGRKKSPPSRAGAGWKACASPTAQRFPSAASSWRWGRRAATPLPGLWGRCWRTGGCGWTRTSRPACPVSSPPAIAAADSCRWRKPSTKGRWRAWPRCVICGTGRAEP